MAAGARTPSEHYQLCPGRHSPCSLQGRGRRSSHPAQRGATEADTQLCRPCTSVSCGGRPAERTGDTGKLSTPRYVTVFESAVAVITVTSQRGNASGDDTRAGKVIQVCTCPEP